MKNFIRYSKKRIVDTENKRPTTEKIIYIRHKRGEVASYLDAYTKENLLPKIVAKYETEKYAKRYSKSDKEQNEYGPTKPLNETKYYTCAICDNPTPNRFRCTPCWEKVSHISAGTMDEDNYELTDFSGFSESYD